MTIHGRSATLLYPRGIRIADIGGALGFASGALTCERVDHILWRASTWRRRPSKGVRAAARSCSPASIRAAVNAADRSGTLQEVVPNLSRVASCGTSMYGFVLPTNRGRLFANQAEGLSCPNPAHLPRDRPRPFGVVPRGERSGLA